MLERPSNTTLLVVFGAHPDYETLVAPGLINLAQQAGSGLELVSANAGEGSCPASATRVQTLA